MPLDTGALEAVQMHFSIVVFCVLRIEWLGEKPRDSIASAAANCGLARAESTAESSLFRNGMNSGTLDRG